MAFFVRFTAFLCVLCSGSNTIQGAGSQLIRIVYNGVVNPPVVYLDSGSIKLFCIYFSTEPTITSYGDAEWVKITDSTTIKQNATNPVTLDSNSKQINLTVKSTGKYTCRYKENPTFYEQTVTVEDVYATTHQTTASPTSHGSDASTGGQTSSTTSDAGTTSSPPTDFSGVITTSDAGTTSSPPTDFGGITSGIGTDSTGSPPTDFNGITSGIGTDSTNSSPSNFEALNPVIYTVVSAAMLGTLTIVAIITCWLRSRKNIHLQTLLPRNSPQDYLDFIQENEFTPMTTSEFLASLQERPPTYVESETIERQMRETDKDSSSGDEGEDRGQQARPPPLPPRNQPRRLVVRQPGSSSSLRVDSAHNQQSSSSGHATSSSHDLIAQRQQGRNLDAQSERGSRSADVHMDSVLAAFVEGIEILEAQRTLVSPPNDGDSEDDETSALNSNETSALLVGVVPSLDAVV